MKTEYRVVVNQDYDIDGFVYKVESRTINKFLWFNIPSYWDGVLYSKTLLNGLKYAHAFCMLDKANGIESEVLTKIPEYDETLKSNSMKSTLETLETTVQ